MTVKAIDPWVNVSMGAMVDTPFMQKVKEEYFKAGDDFFRNIEADELVELMDRMADMCREMGHTRMEVVSLVNLGHTLLDIGRFDEGIRKIDLAM